MKLKIYKPDTYAEQQWWRNYRQSLDKMAWPGNVLRNAYNGQLVTNTVDHCPYIEFDNEEDATLFLLKFS